MLLLIVPLLLMLLSLAIGGRLEQLKALSLRQGWIAVVAFGGQWLLVRATGDTSSPLVGIGFVLSYGLLLGFLWLNRRLPGLKLALAGTLLNLVVTAANGGFMPITPQTLAAAHLNHPAPAIGARVPRSKDRLLPADQARLGWLGDTLTLAWPIGQAFSAGDVLITTGIGGLIFWGMRPRWRRSAKRAPPHRAEPVTPTGATRA